jgi:hypothetical protein
MTSPPKATSIVAACADVASVDVEGAVEGALEADDEVVDDAAVDDAGDGGSSRTGDLHPAIAATASSVHRRGRRPTRAR